MSMKLDYIPGQQCPVCSGTKITPLLEVPQVPVFCNLLLSSFAEAIGIRRGNIHLGYCETCTHIFNAAFQPHLLEYDRTYENALDCSPTFQTYVESLAKELVEKYDLFGKQIVEIGCGQGNFLRIL